LALWTFRNKLTIEGKIIRKVADCMFKTLIFIETWRVLVKPKDGELVETALGVIRGLRASLMT
jgi:hypothetical protein